MTVHWVLIEPVRTSGQKRFRVLYGGLILCQRARDPEHEAARKLVELGITGRMETFFGGKPSMVIDIEAAAALCVIECATEGPRIGRWKAYLATDAQDASLRSRSGRSLNGAEGS
jgi:hypothetical protein